jgi:hypothetical protein
MRPPCKPVEGQSHRAGSTGPFGLKHDRTSLHDLLHQVPDPNAWVTEVEAEGEPKHLKAKFP